MKFGIFWLLVSLRLVIAAFIGFDITLWYKLDDLGVLHLKNTERLSRK